MYVESGDKEKPFWQTFLLAVVPTLIVAMVNQAGHYFVEKVRRERKTSTQPKKNTDEYEDEDESDED